MSQQEAGIQGKKKRKGDKKSTPKTNSLSKNKNYSSFNGGLYIILTDAEVDNGQVDSRYQFSNRFCQGKKKSNVVKGAKEILVMRYLTGRFLRHQECSCFPKGKMVHPL